MPPRTRGGPPRREASGAYWPGRDGVALFDGSRICTLALARYSDRPVPVALTAEVDRLVAERFYERDVLLVRPLGYVQRTAARRISYDDSLRFQAVHEATYRDLGFGLIEIPRADLPTRVTAVREVLDSCLDAHAPDV